MDKLSKDEIEQRNVAALYQDLWEGNLVFASHPREIELQLSNFCNMSCTMCYDGNNPPLIKMPEDLEEKEVVDYLPPDLELRTSKKTPEHFERIRRFYPGFFFQAVGSLKVDGTGNAYPCCVASGENLLLGNFADQGFAEIWNGQPMQDLRQGMMTGHIPGFCHTCNFFNPFSIEPWTSLPFSDVVVKDCLHGQQEIDPTFTVSGPAHLNRQGQSPTFHWPAPARPALSYLLVRAAGGGQNPANLQLEIAGDLTDYQIPEEHWHTLKPNIAWWWTIWAIHEQGPATRMPVLQCLRLADNDSTNPGQASPSEPGLNHGP